MQTQLWFHSHSYPHLVVSPWLLRATKSLQTWGFPGMLCYAKSTSFMGSCSLEILQRVGIQISVIQDLVLALPASRCCTGTLCSFSPPCRTRSNLGCSAVTWDVTAATCVHPLWQAWGQINYFAVMKDWVFSPLPFPTASGMSYTKYPCEKAREKQGGRHFGRAQQC